MNISSLELWNLYNIPLFQKAIALSRSRPYYLLHGYYTYVPSSYSYTYLYFSHIWLITNWQPDAITWFFCIMTIINRLLMIFFSLCFSLLQVSAAHKLHKYSCTHRRSHYSTGKYQIYSSMCNRTFGGKCNFDRWCLLPPALVLLWRSCSFCSNWFCSTHYMYNVGDLMEQDHLRCAIDILALHIRN